MSRADTTTCDEEWLRGKFDRFAAYLRELSAKDEALLDWASWVTSSPVSLAIASVRSGAVGEDLKRAAEATTSQERAHHCGKALEANAIIYGFDLAKFTQPETERVCRYLELLAHAASTAAV